MLERSTIENLNMVINNHKDMKAQHKTFGTHLPKTTSTEELSCIANKMISLCDMWKSNWEMVLEDRKDELEQIRNAQLASKAKILAKYDDEQWNRICAERDRLRASVSA